MRAGQRDVRDTTSPQRSASAPTYLWLAQLPLALFLLLVWGLASIPLPWTLDVPWVPSLGSARASASMAWQRRCWP